MKYMRIIVGILCLFVLTGVISHPMYVMANTPRSGAQLPDRLFKAKAVARKHVERRENELSRLKRVINKLDAKMLRADVTAIETMIAQMQNSLATWRRAINQATTVDELKALHVEAFRNTQIFSVFRRKVNQLIRLSIIQKNAGRLNKRISNQELSLTKKKNVEANTSYEQVRAMIEEARSLHRNIKVAIESLRTRVLAYSSADFNANPTEFRNKTKATSDEIRAVRTNVVNLIKITKQITERLKNLPDL